MSLTETLEKVNIQEQLVEEKDLIVYNDEFNTFEHVIESLIKICGHKNIQAEQCTWIIHHNGKCQVKRGSFKDLMPMCTGLLERGISAEIE
ncbi:MAG: ATP-dependent Clp protease adaptor ClpS [Crocinitomicaceae bacterium]|jgi:ATP-dependent Clp protease adaptor protein ClpS|nr:ATP-dependent Clp protease adaptor ClpS [Crocinitomicaceae bacterium]